MEKLFEVKMKLTGKVLVSAESADDAKEKIQGLNDLDVIDEMYESGELQVMYITEVADNDPEDFI